MIWGNVNALLRCRFRNQSRLNFLSHPAGASIRRPSMDGCWRCATSGWLWRRTWASKYRSWTSWPWGSGAWSRDAGGGTGCLRALDCKFRTRTGRRRAMRSFGSRPYRGRGSCEFAFLAYSCRLGGKSGKKQFLTRWAAFRAPPRHEPRELPCWTESLRTRRTWNAGTLWLRKQRRCYCHDCGSEPWGSIWRKISSDRLCKRMAWCFGARFSYGVSNVAALRRCLNNRAHCRRFCDRDATVSSALVACCRRLHCCPVALPLPWFPQTPRFWLSALSQPGVLSRSIAPGTQENCSKQSEMVKC